MYMIWYFSRPKSWWFIKENILIDVGQLIKWNKLFRIGFYFFYNVGSSNNVVCMYDDWLVQIEWYDFVVR